MKRALAALALLGLVGLGCAREGPLVKVSLALSSGEVAQLARLQLIVRQCDDSQPAFNREFLLQGQRPSAVAEQDISVEPGRSFYVWAQGWSSCEGELCVPLDRAKPGDCTCFDGLYTPAKQRWTHDACSPWLIAAEDLVPVDLELAPYQGECPKNERRSCADPL